MILLVLFHPCCDAEVLLGKPNTGEHALRCVVRYTRVSAKIPVHLREKLRKYGVRVGPLIREAVEREVRRRELEEVDRDMEDASERLRKISDEEFARIIRETRDTGRATPPAKTRPSNS